MEAAYNLYKITKVFTPEYLSTDIVPELYELLDDEEFGIIIAIMKSCGKILMKASGNHGIELEKNLTSLLEKEHPEIEVAFAQNIGRILYSQVQQGYSYTKSFQLVIIQFLKRFFESQKSIVTMKD